MLREEMAVQLCEGKYLSPSSVAAQGCALLSPEQTLRTPDPDKYSNKEQKHLFITFSNLLFKGRVKAVKTVVKNSVRFATHGKFVVFLTSVFHCENAFCK